MDLDGAGLQLRLVGFGTGDGVGEGVGLRLIGPEGAPVQGGK